ncbi:M20 aminoacylase family protein [uncultured Cohaesibacter sp.]|uniref:M20 aminoacylase family protein n=1 Tax=uncultured Cohaesibacter sp. TaxID=1002546 RepID=UPI00293076E8|nr:M20 aminoacylase family protein [uncultured Cohaesibacter sp.]
MSRNNDFACLSDFDEQKQAMTDTRRYLHAHPELSHQEAGTAALVAEKLKGWGYEVVENIGGYGVVGRLKVGDSPRSIAVRADMDALPIFEETELDYKSLNNGVMHACGHDGHTAVLLGAAEYLARTRHFNGTLNLIFQPAEEASGKSGAQRMIEDGLLERFPFDAIYGLHTHPGAPVGQILLREGPSLAAADMIDITVRGKGGHAARPHQAIDPVAAACHIVIGLQMIISRNVDPFDAAVITVGSIQAGDAPNVIPEDAILRMTVRTLDKTVRELIKTRITEVARAIALAHGASVVITPTSGVPVVDNSVKETAFAREIATELVGEDNVGIFPVSSGSEDFAHYLEHRPGSFLRLGNGEESALLHNPNFNFEDEALPVGAALWARLVERYLQV